MATQGQLQKNIVSAVELLDQREIDPSIYDVQRDRQFTDIMKMVNRYEKTSMPTYNDWVNEGAYATSTVSSVTSGSGTAQVVFVVNTNSGFPRVGDLITINNANNVGVQARIQTISYGSGTATITARSVGGNSAPIFVSNGDTVAYQSNAFGEASSAPTNRRYTVTRYSNQVQKFREYDKVTDVQKVAKVETTVNGQSLFTPYQWITKVIKLKGDISYQMFNGVKSDTLFSDANPFLTDAAGNAIQTTGGVNWYITNYGITDSAASLGTFGFTEFNEICDNFIANKAPRDYFVFMSNKSKRTLDVFLKNLNSSGVESVRMMVDGRSVDFEVEQVKYGGFTFDLINFELLDHPDLFSSTIEATVHGSLFFIPKDSIDTIGNGRQPRMKIRHMDSPFMAGATRASDGIIHEFYTGALAPTPTNGDMVLETHWVTDQGLQGLGVKLWQRYRIN